VARSVLLKDDVEGEVEEEEEEEEEGTRMKA
jgi:hypothetical protein